jgi:molecular chaperone GrpE
MGDIDDVVIEESTEDGDEGTAEQKLKKLRDELKESKKVAGENLAGWQRAKADYVNLERRMRSYGEELGQSAVRSVVEAFIPAADSIEAAAKADPGIAAVMRQVDEAFKKQGVMRYTPTEGNTFDPARHESVQILATGKAEEDNTVSECLQSGYELAGTIIRPARVSVKHFTQ